MNPDRYAHGRVNMGESDKNGRGPRDTQSRPPRSPKHRTEERKSWPSKTYQSDRGQDRNQSQDRDQGGNQDRNKNRERSADRGRQNRGADRGHDRKRGDFRERPNRDSNDRFDKRYSRKDDDSLSSGERRFVPEISTIKKVRNEHGTRVARKITCSSCNKKDTIDFVPRPGAHILCRKCAYEKFNVHDTDSESLSKRSYKCSVCARGFLSTLVFENEDEIQCSDCHKGIESKQQNRSKTAQTIKKGVIRVKREKPETDLE